MKQKIILISLLLVLFETAIFAQSNFKLQTQALAEASPESVGMSAERLKRIDDLLQSYLKDQKIAGAVAVVARKGKIVYQKNMGSNGIGNQSEMKKDDIFRIASMTKPITSLALMMLYEEGKFLLDEPLSKYIPEFKNPQILTSFNEKDSSYTAEPAKKQITIRHILTHTSGIPYGFIEPKKFGKIFAKASVPDLANGGKFTIADKMKMLAKLPLAHEPGEKWTYGLSSDVCGYLVEVLSGMSLSDFCEKRIFEPLEMKDTHFFYPESEEKRLVKVQFSNKEGKAEKYTNQPEAQFTDFPVKGAKMYYSGGSGLSSTAIDYLKFCQMILNGGEYNGKRLLSRKTVELMSMNQVGDLCAGWSCDKFGLGFSILTEKNSHKNLGSIGRLGWGGIFNTAFWIDAKEGIAAVIMMQIYPFSHNEIFQKFENAVYQAVTD